MSFLSQNTSARTRVRKWCALCGEVINVGESKVVRNGTDGGDFWTMHMHIECEAYESQETVDDEWYYDCSEPAFERADAVAAFEKAKEAK
jgi:hypothetical protein